MASPAYYAGYPDFTPQRLAYPAAFNRRAGQLADGRAAANGQLAGAFQTFPVAAGNAVTGNFLAGCTENDVLLNLMIIAMSVFALRDQIFGEDFASARRRRRRRDLDLDLDLGGNDLEVTVVTLGRMYDKYKARLSEETGDEDVDKDVDKTEGKIVDTMFKRMRSKLYQANDVLTAREAVQSLSKLLIDFHN